MTQPPITSIRKELNKLKEATALIKGACEMRNVLHPPGGGFCAPEWLEAFQKGLIVFMQTMQEQGND